MKIKQSQTWLFAFTDLAFLLLISLSLIPSAPNITMHFSEMDIPSVPNNPNMSPLSKDAHTWELQVYRKSEKHPKPFRLVRIGMQRNSGKDLRSGYLDRDTLIPKLRELKKSSDTHAGKTFTESGLSFCGRGDCQGLEERKRPIQSDCCKTIES